MEEDFVEEKTSIGRSSYRRRNNKLADARKRVLTGLTTRIPDWRRVFFLLGVALPCAILGVYQIHLGVSCYIGGFRLDDRERIEERKKRCVMVDVDSLAVTAAMLGVVFLILACFSVLGAVLLLRIKPSETDTGSLVSEKESLLEV